MPSTPSPMSNAAPKAPGASPDAPRDLQMVAAATDLKWLDAAASEGAAPTPRRFEMTAYTGGAMQLAGWRYPVVIDLAGLQSSAKPKVFLEHDHTQRVGHIDAVNITPSQLAVSGVISASGKAAQEVQADAAAGFPWQASLGRSREHSWRHRVTLCGDVFPR